MPGTSGNHNGGCLQVVSMSEELRRALYSSSSLTSLDLEAFLPEVVGTSDIINDNVRKVRQDHQHILAYSSYKPLFGNKVDIHIIIHMNVDDLTVSDTHTEHVQEATSPRTRIFLEVGI